MGLLIFHAYSIYTRIKFQDPISNHSITVQQSFGILYLNILEMKSILVILTV